MRAYVMSDVGRQPALSNVATGVQTLSALVGLPDNPNTHVQVAAARHCARQPLRRLPTVQGTVPKKYFFQLPPACMGLSLQFVCCCSAAVDPLQLSAQTHGT
jgi:hypothetical protein